MHISSFVTENEKRIRELEVRLDQVMKQLMEKEATIKDLQAHIVKLVAKNIPEVIL